MQELTLTLTDMANGGAALGRDDQQRVIFVPFTIPGEEVTVGIIEDKKRFARGRLLQVLEPSPHRVDPPCPYFGMCGGCHFQHIDYPTQLELKESVIKDQLKRIGRIENPEVQPVISNPEPWRHSHQVTFGQTADGKLGFWSPQQREILPVESCHILHEPLLAAFQEIDLDFPNLNQLTLRMGSTGELMVVVSVEDDEPPGITADFPASIALLLIDGQAINLLGDPFIHIMAQDQLLRVSAASFYYPSPPGLSLLIEQLLKYAALNGDEHIWDLYSGVGTLSLFLAPHAKSIIGVESNPDSIADAAANLDGFEHISLYEGPVEHVLPLLEGSPDLIVVDPPPSGLAPGVTDEIAKRSPDRLIYISSDIATFARDSRRLAKKGFILNEVQPIDMYPQNYRALLVSIWQPEGHS